MSVAYDWAFLNPVRKVYYNISITGLSVAVAFLIGSIELDRSSARQRRLAQPAHRLGQQYQPQQRRVRHRRPVRRHVGAGCRVLALGQGRTPLGAAHCRDIGRRDGLTGQRMPGWSYSPGTSGVSSAHLSRCESPSTVTLQPFRFPRPFAGAPRWTTSVLRRSQRHAVISGLLLLVPLLAACGSSSGSSHPVPKNGTTLDLMRPGQHREHGVAG